MKYKFIENLKLLFNIYSKYLENFVQFLNKHSKIICTIAFIAFAILTTVGILYSEPWFDEAQAWLIAKNLGPIEILRHMRYEGHMFVWFYILMPFAKLNIPYPLPMQIANMLFMWGGIYIFLKKAPINPFLKVLITFSVPFTYQYGIVARCYSVGIFLLFLLAALFKDKLRHPYLYSILIFLCANTSVMALFGAAAFGVLFLYDYIKEKPQFYKSKEFYGICLISIFCLWAIGFQLIGAEKMAVSLPSELIKEKFHNIFFITISNGIAASILGFKYQLCVFTSVIYVVLSLLLFWKDKRAFSFFVITTASMLSLFGIFYKGFMWHHYFYFVYFIIALWLLCLNMGSKKGILYILTILFLCIITVRLDYMSYLFYKETIKVTDSNAKAIANRINSAKNIKSGNLVICDERAHNVVPYLNDLKIPVYNCLSNSFATYYDRSSELNMRLKSKMISPKYFKKFENKDIYLLVTNGPTTELFSDYYKLSLEFCEKPAPSDDVQLCVIKLTPGY